MDCIYLTQDRVQWQLHTKLGISGVAEQLLASHGIGQSVGQL